MTKGGENQCDLGLGPSAVKNVSGAGDADEVCAQNIARSLHERWD